MAWRELRVLLALARREFHLGTRGAFVWALMIVGGLYALWRTLASGGSLALACYHTVQFATLALGVAAVLLGGAAGVRDIRDKAQELVLAKRLGNRPLLVAARFLGTWLALIFVVLVMLGVVLVGELLVGGNAWAWATYANALLRAAVPLALATALGFTLATYFATPLAAVVAAIYWVAVPLAQAHLPILLDVRVSQHAPPVILTTLALVTFCGWRYGKSIAGVSRAPVAATAAAFGLAALLAVGVLLGQRQDANGDPDPVLAAMSLQSALPGARAPGFWLPRADGRFVGMEDFHEQRVLLVFWSPSDAAAGPLLATLRRYRARTPACVAVCVDHDAATLAPFAREAGPGVTVVWDRGRHFMPGRTTLDSALVTAYDLDETPTLFPIGADRVLERRGLPFDPAGFAALAARYGAR